jgi:hypothetical protein
MKTHQMGVAIVGVFFITVEGVFVPGGFTRIALETRNQP